METLSQSLRRTINVGAPLYNEGKKKECFELYLEATNIALSQEILAKSAIGELLSQAAEEASELGQKQAYGEAAWVLRHCFDEILEKRRAGALMLDRGPKGDDSVSDTSWQDEKVAHESDFEKGQAIANTDYILRASLTNQPGGSAAAAPEQVELFESSKERDALDSGADLYAIILATEHLERAYARDAITQKEYTTECQKLISQFRLAEKAALRSSMTTEDFMKMYQMDCPRATERLLKWGVPEPMRGGDGGGDDDHHIAVTVAETVQFFITAMDAVKLEQRAVDELQPLLSDLMDALVRLPETPNDFDPNEKVKKWLQKLNAMRAVDEIDEDDARQLSHDLDAAYAEFTRYLKRKK